MQSLWDFLFGTEPIEWFQHAVGLGHPDPFRVASLLGDTWGVIFAAGLAFWLFGRRALYAAASAAGVAAVLKVVLSRLFSVARPEGPEIVVYEQLQVASFPSGHVFLAVAVWGVLYALGYVRLWVPLLVAILVAVGRFYLGVHFVGDLLGSLLFGALFAWAFEALWPRVEDALCDRSPTFYYVAAGVTAAAVIVWLFTLGQDPRRYEMAGIILGAAVGLPLEYHVLRYHPETLDAARRIAWAFLGAAAVTGLAVWARFGFGSGAIWPQAVLAGLATLWAVFLAPALFRASTRHVRSA